MSNDGVASLHYSLFFSDLYTKILDIGPIFFSFYLLICKAQLIVAFLPYMSKIRLWPEQVGRRDLGIKNLARL